MAKLVERPRFDNLDPSEPMDARVMKLMLNTPPEEGEYVFTSPRMTTVKLSTGTVSFAPLPGKSKDGRVRLAGSFYRTTDAAEIEALKKHATRFSGEVRLVFPA